MKALIFGMVTTERLYDFGRLVHLSVGGGDIGGVLGSA